MVMLMMILTVAVPLIWLGLTLLFLPAVITIARRPSERWDKWDPLQAALSLLAFNLFWFGSRRWVFGSRVDLMTDPEIVWRLGTLGCSVGCALVLVRVVQFYKKHG